MGVPSFYWSTALLRTSWSGRHLGSAWPLTYSVLITRPYHWPGTQLNLTAGPTTDLRGYEPNEPAHWWDSFRQAIPEFPWGALPHSYPSPLPPHFFPLFSLLFIPSLSSIPLKEICVLKPATWFFSLYIYQFNTSHLINVSQTALSLQCFIMYCF